ncbi:MAG: glycosyltransferase family A protein [Flavobacteriaceae bacterium]|nr:glycosyltransferase family A protein [Flavobacteriaceae bacterium]
MLSILLPSYNYNLFPLVKELHQQLINENIPFEIVCMDDASELTFVENNLLVNLEHVSFHILEKNIGRSAIRNKLAEKATYNWLLFLDADVFPKDSNFIKNYIAVILNNTQNKTVYCGGIIYNTEIESENIYLRWNVGRNGEQCLIEERIKNPFRKFFSANFLIQKESFKEIKFNQYLNTYGYEDVIFASDLKINNFLIVHFQNYVYHLGIEFNADYLNKTKIAIESLLKYYQKGILNKENVKLLIYYERIHKLKAVFLFSFIYKVIGKSVENYLTKGKSKIVVFNFYKIIYFCYLSSK